MVGDTGVFTAYLSAGSNLGERKANLDQAIAGLREGGAVPRQISHIFETEPVGFRDQPWFLNLAIMVETPLSPRELLSLCQKTEEAMGRRRTFRDAPRVVDLDILLYGNEVIAEPDLVIPHPRMKERRFVLEPLAQIAPDVDHPLERRSIRSLLELCPDSSIVRPYFSGDPT